MANVIVKLNRSGVRDLLRSQDVADFCDAQAARMTRATGAPYVADVYVGRNRVNAGVYRVRRLGSSDAAGEKGSRGYYLTLKTGGIIYVKSSGRKK